MKVTSKAVMEAAARCRLVGIRKLLAAGARAKQLVTAKTNAVTEAAFGFYGGMNRGESIRLALIRELVRAGCPVEGQALFRPVDLEELRILKFLIEHGADVNAEAAKSYYYAANKGVCPLYVAIMLRRIAALKLLVKAGADVNQVTGPIYRFGVATRQPLINWATTFDFGEAVKLMARAGADVEVRDAQGFTALFYAAWRNHVEAAKALIAAGADVNRPTKQGWLPLQVAREKLPAEIDRFLGWLPPEPGKENKEQMERLLIKAGAREV